MFQTDNDYRFNYNFLANFYIYTYGVYLDHFYNPTNAGLKPIKEFRPLKPKEAEEFLRFISQAGAFVDVKEKLPDYYNLLIGAIENPDEVVKTKLSFLIYFYLCMDVQMAEYKEQTNFGLKQLSKWLEDPNNLAESEVQSTMEEVWDEMADYLLEEYDKVLPSWSAVSDEKDIEKYSLLIVNILGVTRALDKMNQVNYLNSYIGLLDAFERNDAIDIALTSSECAYSNVFATKTGDPDKMERYAKYTYSIYRSLFD